MSTNKSVIKLYEESFISNATLPALTDYFSKKTYTYLETAEEIKKLHLLLSQAGVKKGDHVALIGKNNARWIITYIGVITYGAVIVPILPNFSPIDTTNIINHSDSLLLFSDKSIFATLKVEDLKNVRGVFDTDDNWSLLADCDGTIASAKESSIELFKSQFAAGFNAEAIQFNDSQPDDDVIISYTSGTSGMSKGVVLTVGNITANVKYAIGQKLFFKGSRVLSILPLAHIYGCTFDMLTPLTIGSHITLLGRTPSPQLLIQAMQSVRPYIILFVPLVMEKIVLKKVMPKLQKQPVKTLVKLPLVRNLIYKKVRNQMLDSFGGDSLYVCIMGGAALNPDVEKLLMDVKFPFTTGYGMTEAAPLISYIDKSEHVFASCGKAATEVEIKFIKRNEADRDGEVCIKGAHVTKGYYKNPKATAACTEEDGWFNTGDMGYMDKDGYLYLTGRSKNMILSSNGQNIYPEEIEAKLSTMSLVTECLVIEEAGHLIALVVPDFELIKKQDMTAEAIKAIMNDNLARLNSIVAQYENVKEIRLCAEEFEKTPKSSIKRFLYPARAKYLTL